ncbi:MAG: hypothetical protein WBN35_07545, partial [Acidimicrobiia bacterium]
MKKTVIFLIIALALVASACAEGESNAVRGDDSKTVAETSTTTSPAPDTAVTSSTGPETSTTTSTTSTTMVTSQETSEVQALFASIKSDADITSARVEGTFEVTGLDQQESGLSEMT